MTAQVASHYGSPQIHAASAHERQQPTLSNDQLRDGFDNCVETLKQLQALPKPLTGGDAYKLGRLNQDAAQLEGSFNQLVRDGRGALPGLTREQTLAIHENNLAFKSALQQLNSEDGQASRQQVAAQRQHAGRGRFGRQIASSQPRNITRSSPNFAFEMQQELNAFQARANNLYALPPRKILELATHFGRFEAFAKKNNVEFPAGLHRHLQQVFHQGTRFAKFSAELKDLNDGCVKELGVLQNEPTPFNSYNALRLKTLKQTASSLQNNLDSFVAANPGRPLPGFTPGEMAKIQENSALLRNALNTLDQAAQSSYASPQRQDTQSSSSGRSSTMARFAAKMDKLGARFDKLKTDFKSSRRSSSTYSSSASSSASSATTVSQQSWERYSDYDVAKLKNEEIAKMAGTLSYPSDTSVSAHGGGYRLSIKANDMLEFLAKNPSGTAAEFGPEYRDHMTGSAGNNDYYGYMLSGGLSNSHELGEAINARLQEMRRVIAEQIDKQTGVFGKADA